MYVFVFSVFKAFYQFMHFSVLVNLVVECVSWHFYPMFSRDFFLCVCVMQPKCASHARQLAATYQVRLQNGGGARKKRDVPNDCNAQVTSNVRYDASLL